MDSPLNLCHLTLPQSTAMVSTNQDLCLVFSQSLASLGNLFSSLARPTCTLIY